jgi:CheY-like chemotaxis protein
MSSPVTRQASHVLVVDDDHATREALVQLIREAHGCAVTDAANGLLALEQLKAATPRPSLIFLDLMMPVLDGIEFLHRKGRDPRLADIPVCIMTGSPGRDPRLQGPDVVAVLRKPFAAELVLSLLERHTGPVGSLAR